MIKIAICDDEVTTLHRTKLYLEEYPIKFSIDEFTSGESLLQSPEKYEIILLDIDMAGINGIETAKKIRQQDKNVKIIYVTNYTDYTTFAFSVHAFAYLLKPVKKEELFQQLDEAFEYTKHQEPELIEFQTEDGIVRLKLHEILYFEYQNRKVFLKTEKETFSLRAKITQIGEQMKEKGFEMPHKSFVVNLYAVKRIQGYDIYLTDNTIIPLSQKKSATFRKALNRYLSQEGGMWF